MEIVTSRQCGVHTVGARITPWVIAPKILLLVSVLIVTDRVVGVGAGTAQIGMGEVRIDNPQYQRSPRDHHPSMLL